MLDRHLVSPDRRVSDLAEARPSRRLPWADIGPWIDGMFASTDARLSPAWAWRGAVVALLAVQSLLILTHAAWLDEWQALQIALQSPSLAALLDNLHYEGHPPLWYLLLRAVGLVVPYALVLAVTQLAISLSTQALILLRAPFGRFERLLIGGSYFILYEFGTLSRSLGLGMLLIVAFFAARSRPAAWAAVVLLPMVDFQFGLLSLVALPLLVRDGRWSWVGAGLWAASGLLAALSVIPAPDMQPALELPQLAAGFLKMISSFSALLVPFHTMDGQINWGGGLPHLLGPLGGALFLFFSMKQTSRVPLHSFLFRGFLYATIAFTLFVYPLGIRHLTLVALLMILLKWREVQAGGALDAAFRAWLVSIALGGLAVIAIVANRPFDMASHAAAFIEERGLADKLWVSFPDSTGQVVAGLLDRDMYMLKKNCTQSFIRWDFRDGIRDMGRLDRALRDTARNHGRFYLVTGYDLTDPRMIPMQRLAHFAPGYNGRTYNLYLVAPQLAETGRPVLPCKPPRRPLREAAIWSRRD